jgi:hypothetical protein
MMSREVLTADRTLYVRSDALYTDAPGLIDSQAGACQTWQQAINLAQALDFNGHTVTLQHGSESAHTFAEGLSFGTRVGGGVLVVKGQSTAGNTVFDPAGSETFRLDNTQGPVGFQNLTARNGTGTIWSVVNGSRCEIYSGVVMGAATTYHIWVHDRQSLLYILNASFTISGSAVAWLFINMGSAFIENSNVTFVSTPAFSGAFVYVVTGGALQSPLSSPLTTASGSATGPRYHVDSGGVINTYGGGASYFPGNSAGSSTGGTYA